MLVNRESCFKKGAVSLIFIFINRTLMLCFFLCVCVVLFRPFPAELFLFYQKRNSVFVNLISRHVTFSSEHLLKIKGNVELL